MDISKFIRSKNISMLIFFVLYKNFDIKFIVKLFKFMNNNLF